MSPVCEASPRQSRGSTQPLGWDWVSDWSDLEAAVTEVESQVRWDWRRELASLHRALDDLEGRIKAKARA